MAHALIQAYATGHVRSCAISTLRRAYSPAVISAHLTYRTHCHICPTRYSFTPKSSEAFESEMHCPRTQHIKKGEKLYLEQAGFETARQSATRTKH